MSWIRAFAVDEPGVDHFLAYMLSPTNDVSGSDRPLDVETYDFGVTLERP